MDRTLAIAGSPTVAGGMVAQIIVTQVLRQKELMNAEIFGLVILIVQGIIGMPITSILLKKEAQIYLDNGQFDKSNTAEGGKPKKRLIPQIPEQYQTSSVLLAKGAILTSVGYYLSSLTGGVVNQLIVCLLLGIFFTEIGVIEKAYLDKAKASGLIMIIILLAIFANIGMLTLEMLIGFLVPLAVIFIIGVAIVISGLLMSKLLKVSRRMAIAIGLSSLIGFPPTYLISKEVSKAVGKTDEEIQIVEDYILPQMVTAGFVTVSIASVIIAGVVTRLL